MQHNVHAFDRGVRIGLGILMLLWGVMTDTNAWPWLVIGLAAFATGALAWCPTYRSFGRRSCRSK